MKVDLILIDRVDRLIAKKATGKPKQLAEKLGISVSSWYYLRLEIEKRGVPIEYSKILGSYRYVEEVASSAHFLRKVK